jgi:hypothetical protein
MLVFVAGIAGMIVGSIQNSSGFAITFGVISAVAALTLIVVTSVAPPESLSASTRWLRHPGRPGTVRSPASAWTSDSDSLSTGPAAGRGSPFDETIARDVETRIATLVADGADEAEMRRLVRLAVELGRGARS